MLPTCSWCGVNGGPLKSRGNGSVTVLCLSEERLQWTLTKALCVIKQPQLCQQPLLLCCTMPLTCIAPSAGGGLAGTLVQQRSAQPELGADVSPLALNVENIGLAHAARASSARPGAGRCRARCAAPSTVRRPAGPPGSVPVASVGLPVQFSLCVANAAGSSEPGMHGG